NFITVAVMMFAVITSSWGKEDDPKKEEEIHETTKPVATTFKFAANGKSCGITDGYADQQHTLPKKIHLNTDKCNGESYRPTITLDFGEAPTPGTYTVSESAAAAKEVKVISYQYNYTDWTGTKGTVVVTTNADD